MLNQKLFDGNDDDGEQSIGYVLNFSTTTLNKYVYFEIYRYTTLRIDDTSTYKRPSNKNLIFHMLDTCAVGSESTSVFVVAK